MGSQSFKALVSWGARQNLLQFTVYRYGTALAADKAKQAQ